MTTRVQKELSGFYQEGVFTPTIQFGGASVGITYTLNAGNYVRVGNLVNFQADITLSSKGSSTGAASVVGLPFLAKTTGNVPIVQVMTFSNFTLGDLGTVVGRMAGGFSVITLGKMTAIGSGNLDNTHFSNTSRLFITGSYICDN